jgi:hypothetical protein
MTTNTALITDKVELFKKIDLWGAKGKKWAEEGHNLAMSALSMSAKHGDIGPVNRLLLAMPKGTKVTSMMSWVLMYGPFIQNADKASVNEKPVVYTKDKECDLASAAQDPWYTHQPDSVTDQVLDVQKAIQAIIQKAKGKELVHGELLTGLQSLMAMSATLTKVTDSETGEETDGE